jgi:hypothetical protein
MKRITYIVIVIVFLLFSSPALGLSLETKITPSDADVKQYETTVFELEIRNNQNVKDSFLISVDGPHLEWKMPGDILLVIGPGEKKKTKLSFYPLERGLYEYTITVKSFNFPELVSTEAFSMNVNPRPMAVKDFSAKTTGDSLLLTLNLMSSEDVEAQIDFIIKNGEKTVKTISTTQAVGGSKRIEKTLYIGDFVAGHYSVEAVIGGNIERDEFIIEPVHRIVEEKEVRHGLLYDEVVVAVSNLGNVAEDYEVTSSVEKNLLTGFVTRPKSCFTGQNYRVCSFELNDIQPKSTARIGYRIEYWPTYSQILGIIAVVLVLGSLSYTEITKPRIRKRHFDKKGREHHIILEVKNPHKTVKNVIVRDFVSPLADVVHKFEHMKPIVKKSEAGTEIIWKIGHMKPKEERVLNYRIKPLVEGNLKMPKAYLRYKPKKGKRARVYSRHLVVNAM